LKAELFEQSSALVFFEYFRVPSRVTDRQRPVELPEACCWVRSTESGRLLLWPSDAFVAPASERLGPVTYCLRSMELYGRVVPDSRASDLLDASWTRKEELRDRSGHYMASIWSDSNGNVFVPFDPNETVTNFWQEAYDVAALLRNTRLMTLSRAAYYYVRPLFPRAAKVGLRRLLARAQQRLPFPRWPVESSLHDFYAFLFDVLGDLAGSRLPAIAPWPHDHTWALVLTHDVETLTGYRNIHLLRGLELDVGYRSSWNFVPRKYPVDDALVNDLIDDGFEVGVHGLDHDGRDFESWRTFSERLPLMREFAKRWNAVGFRSPATHRVWEWMPLLGFDYDSSYPDTDPYEPQPGGCCSWLPYFNRDLVELPITLPQDYTVFTVLGHEDGRLWLEKARFLRERGGMALLITHPDYMLDRPPRNAYRHLLETFRHDKTAWRALPRDVSRWWRQRAASRLERTGSDWRIVGPAAEAGRVVHC
jgi:hypothetical protein